MRAVSARRRQTAKTGAPEVAARSARGANSLDMLTDEFLPPDAASEGGTTVG